MAGVGWGTARALAASVAGPVEPVVVPLEAAAGLVVAEDVLALTDLPATDTSAMDGWAVAGPPPWRPVGEVLAGARPPALRPGECVAIATGAMLPEGAHAVLRREQGRQDAAGATTGAAAMVRPESEGLELPAGTDIRVAGGECRAGDVVLPAGSTIRPPALGMLAAAGLDRVSVRRVSADLLVLGDELLTAGPAREGRLRDALGPLLTAWLPACGVAVASRRHVPDTATALRLALGGCVADVVVTTGSTARGPVDHLHAVLAELGATLVVDGVAVRPGHPQVLALLPDGRPLVGLPGNPLAAVSGLLTLFGPVAAALSGAPPGPSRRGPLVEEVGAGRDATRLVPVRDGRPVLFAGPGMLRGLASADAVAVVPPGGVRAGQDVELLALP